MTAALRTRYIGYWRKHGGAQALDALEQIKKHAASVLSRAADAAEQAGVPCDTMQVENARPYQAVIAA